MEKDAKRTVQCGKADVRTGQILFLQEKELAGGEGFGSVIYSILKRTAYRVKNITEEDNTLVITIERI